MKQTTDRVYADRTLCSRATKCHVGMSSRAFASSSRAFLRTHSCPCICNLSVSPSTNARCIHLTLSQSRVHKIRFLYLFTRCLVKIRTPIDPRKFHDRTWEKRVTHRGKEQALNTPWAGLFLWRLCSTCRHASNWMLDG